MEKAVLRTLESKDYEVFTDGVFYTTEGNNKIELNINDLQIEVRLLRKELSKFE